MSVNVAVYPVTTLKMYGEQQWNMGSFSTVCEGINLTCKGVLLVFSFLIAVT